MSEIPAGDEIISGWRRASEVAGLPVANLRRRVERDELPAVKGEDGTYTFNRTNLEALRPKSSSPLATSTSDSREGANGHPEPFPPAASKTDEEAVAAIFAALTSGMQPAEIVAEHERSPEFVKKSFNQWVELRRLDPKLVLPAEWVIKLENLETTVRELTRVIVDPQSEDPLIDRVANLESVMDRVIRLESLVSGDPLAGLQQKTCGCRVETALGWHPE
jgi:hypothetical protein